MKKIKEIFGEHKNEDINLLFRGEANLENLVHVESDLVEVNEGIQVLSGIVEYQPEKRFFRYVYEYDSWGELEAEEDIIDLVDEVFAENVIVRMYMTKEEKAKYDQE